MLRLMLILFLSLIIGSWQIVVKEMVLRTYNREDVMNIRKTMIDVKWKNLELDTCITIRRLRLNKRGRWAGKKIKESFTTSKQGSINLNNLTVIESKQNCKIHNRIKVALVNIQSLKSKDNDLLTYLSDNKLDLCILTETWLTQEDDSWISCSDLNITNFRLSTSNQINRRGGGLALVHKTALSTKKLDEGQLRSFQFAVWSTKIPGSNMTIIAIYHPPYSTKCPVTNSMFLDDFTEWLPSQLVKYNNILLARDFNIHMNKATTDNEPGLFVSTIEAMGFHVELCSTTHRSGNTIDLMSIQSGCHIGVPEMRCGPYLSDHCSIEMTTTVQHSEAYREKINYRKIKDINIESFIEDCDLSSLSDEGLDVMVEQLGSRFEEALNKNAPIKTKIATIRKTVPWFNDSLRDHKRVV